MSAWHPWLRWAPAFALAAFALVAVTTICIRPEGWLRRDSWQRFWAYALAAVTMVIALVSLPAFVALYGRLDWGHLKAIVGVAALLLPILGAGKAAERVANVGGKFALYVLGLLGPLALLLMCAHLARYLIQDPGKVSFALWVAAGLFVWNWFSFDANATSMLMFYRDRLSRAYLFRWRPESNGDPPQNDEQKLSALEARGPYHIINATLNLQGSSGPLVAREELRALYVLQVLLRQLQDGSLFGRYA